MGHSRATRILTTLHPQGHSNLLLQTSKNRLKSNLGCENPIVHVQNTPKRCSIIYLVTYSRIFRPILFFGVRAQISLGSLVFVDCKQSACLPEFVILRLDFRELGLFVTWHHNHFAVNGELKIIRGLSQILLIATCRDYRGNSL